MLGSPCSPCCGTPGDVCLVFTGSGFSVPTTWQLQDMNGGGVVMSSSASLNTRWYGRVPQSDIVSAYSRNVIGVYGVGGVAVNSVVLPVWGDAVADGMTWYGQVQSCLSNHQPIGRYGIGSAYLQYFFNSANGASSPAYVDLVVAGFRYRRQYTVATLPNVGDQITFVPQDVVSSSQGTAGTVVVRQLNTSDRAARDSVFQAASEVQLRLTARSQSQTISFARTTETPNCYLFFSMTNYAAPRYAQSPVFKHIDSQHGTSWIVTVDPTCSWSGKLEVHLFGKLPLPGTPNPSVYEDFDYIVFDGTLSEASGGAAPISFHNDYEAAVFGTTDFPAFPITLWSNRAFWFRDNYGQTLPGDPFVVAEIIGVL